MKPFFQHLNFVRVITILSILGAGALGYLDWKQREHLLQSRAALAKGGRIEQLSARIQENALLFSDIENEIKSDQLVSSGGNMESYIRTIAANPDVAIGQVTVRPSRPREVTKGIEDRNYDVLPMADATYRRENIANFFTLIEGNSPRIRVTDIEITNSSKVKAHEVPSDKWSFTATVTSRQKKEQ